jgi:hypothetical protein
MKGPQGNRPSLLASFGRDRACGRRPPDVEPSRGCRYRCVAALALPRLIRHSRRQLRLPKSVGYSAQQVSEALDEDMRDGFIIPVPESHQTTDGTFQWGFTEVYMTPSFRRLYIQQRNAFERELRKRGEDQRADALPPIRLVRPGTVEHTLALLQGGVIFLSEPPEQPSSDNGR